MSAPRVWAARCHDCSDRAPETLRQLARRFEAEVIECLACGAETGLDELIEALE